MGVESSTSAAVHGFKAHVWADATTALVEKVSVTPTNVNDGRAVAQVHFTAIDCKLKRSLNILPTKGELDQRGQQRRSTHSSHRPRSRTPRSHLNYILDHLAGRCPTRSTAPQRFKLGRDEGTGRTVTGVDEQTP